MDAGDGRLQRVQVKTTTQRRANGTYVVNLRVSGGNQSFHTSRTFDPDEVELLYVLADDGTRYLIPAQAVEARTSLTLHPGLDRMRC